ncbi:MAG: hypothetical protein RM347_032650 [Nostoc sp. ChiQUE02]|uniref:hypothetical protein n=1 Tax=Nostoc sp. ChiQUE02 TaxID=3075377 RepID=UPI002AD49773|nr:hypothetical protein [Nostoc sp. ChiQUE02]MDZ8228911.1 hypothetical protein [Nostoc sp. ChiQUE02]
MRSQAGCRIMRSHQQSNSFTAISTTGYSAIALSRKLVLLTRNHRDLGKVLGLLIEDWTV